MTEEAQKLCNLLGLVGQHGRMLDGIRRGHTNEEIALGFGVRVGTIKSRLHKLYKRIGVSNRVEAALLAERTLIEYRLRAAEQHAQAQRKRETLELLGDLLAYLARPRRACTTDAPDPGPHLPTRPWANPDYDGGTP